MASERITSKNLASVPGGSSESEEQRLWMIERLEAHLALLKDEGNVEFTEKQRDLALTQRIIAKVSPETPLVIEENDGNWDWVTRVAIERTLGLLEHAQDIERFLGPDGPKMAVDRLHPVIWNAAADLWNDGHYKDAVVRALRFLNAHIQAVSTRTNLSEKALVTEVFGDGVATVERPRLRWTDDIHGDTERSMREGIRSFAVGVFQGIRNPVTHGTDDMPKQIAVEQLASLSVLARWVDETKLDLHDGNPDPKA